MKSLEEKDYLIVHLKNSLDTALVVTACLDQMFLLFGYHFLDDDQVLGFVKFLVGDSLNNAWK